MTGRRTGVGVGVGEMERFGRRHSYLEVFKACRLCGSGGGYKMPIVQASPPQHLAEPELRHKIRDCCSIDVRPNDKMPPLICELCVDKVNDFFEFREMCRATNSKVRTSLGLPPQTLTQELSEDCILGVSGPVIYVSKESDEPARARTKPALKRGRRKADAPRVSFQDQVPSKPPPLPAPAPAPSSPSPQDAKRSLRHTKEPLSLLAERMGTRKRERSCVSPQPLLEKRPRFSSSVVKKVETVAVKARAETRRAKAPALPPLPPPPPKKIATPYNCIVCKTGFTKQKLLTQHLGQMHSPAIFSDRMGCAPCREWFASVRLADDHHKWHKTSSVFYSCWRCSAEFKLLQSYNKHFALRQCIPEEIVPDPVCDGCHKNFATENLKSAHRCAPAASVGNCSKCKRHFSKRIQLRRHEKICTVSVQSSPEVNPNNPHLKSLKLVHVTVSKCDNLLQHIKKEPIDSEDAFDSSANVIVKSEPADDGEQENPLGAEVKQEIKEEYLEYGDADFQNNDSGSDSDSAHPNLVVNPFARRSDTQVESLSFISLRSIFSNRPFRKKQKTKKATTKRENVDGGAKEAVANLIITSVQGNDCADRVDFDSLISESVSDSTSKPEERRPETEKTEDDAPELDRVRADPTICENERPREENNAVAEESPPSDENITPPTVEQNCILEDTISKTEDTAETVSSNVSDKMENSLCNIDFNPEKDITDEAELNEIDKTIKKLDRLDFNYDEEETDKIISKLEDEVEFNYVKENIGKASDAVRLNFDRTTDVTNDVGFNFEKRDVDKVENATNDIEFNFKKQDTDKIERAGNDVEFNFEKRNTDKTESVANDVECNFEKRCTDVAEDVEFVFDKRNTDNSENLPDNLNLDFEKRNSPKATSALENIGLNYDDDDDDEESGDRRATEPESLELRYDDEDINKTTGEAVRGPILELNDDSLVGDIGTESRSSPEKNGSSNVTEEIDAEKSETLVDPLEDRGSNDEKPEREVLDLVSDSGDDCNIIDSPDKTEFGEDRPQAEDVEETKVSNPSEEPDRIPSDSNVPPSESETDDIIADICDNFVSNSDFSCDKNLQNNAETDNVDSSEAHRMDVDEALVGDAFNFDGVVTTDVEMAE